MTLLTTRVKLISHEPFHDLAFSHIHVLCTHLCNHAFLSFEQKSSYPNSNFKELQGLKTQQALVADPAEDQKNSKRILMIWITKITHDGDQSLTCYTLRFIDQTEKCQTKTGKMKFYYLVDLVVQLIQRFKSVQKGIRCN